MQSLTDSLKQAIFASMLVVPLFAALTPSSGLVVTPGQPVTKLRKSTWQLGHTENVRNRPISFDLFDRHEHTQTRTNVKQQRTDVGHWARERVRGRNAMRVD